MIRTFLSAGIGQQLELCGSELDGASRGFVQPVEARVESRITAGRVTGELEVAVEAGLDARRFAVDAEEQQLCRGFGQVKEREQEKAKSILFDGVCREGRADRN